MSRASIDYRVGQVNTVRLRTSQGGFMTIMVETSPLTRVFYDPGSAFEGLQVNEDSTGSAALYTDRSVHPSSVLIGNGGAIYQLTGGFVLRCDSLQILTDGLLDISDGAMIVDYGESFRGGTLEFVQEQITRGRNGGNGMVFGIRSSTAAADPNHNTTLGAMEATDYKSFYGPGRHVPRPADRRLCVLVKYTYNGDANFSGIVDFDDYVQIDVGFNAGSHRLAQRRLRRQRRRSTSTTTC